MRILGLGTYPIRKPLHGGQRRVDAISRVLNSESIPYEYVGVFRRETYPTGAGNEDLQLSKTDTPFDAEPYLDDLRAGIFLNVNPEATHSLIRKALARKVTHIQLEQPFTYPIIEHVDRMGLGDRIALIYSSQNVEAPLKRGILARYGRSSALMEDACKLVEQWERTAVARADLIVAASDGDAQVYRSWGGKRIIVCRNGVDVFPIDPRMKKRLETIFGETGRFLLVVGSGHPPNATGFLKLVVEPAVSFVPPLPAIAVVGGMGHLVWQDSIYQGGRPANDRRVQFFIDVTDAELGALKDMCHAFILPITEGGGSNLKTAEALVSGKHILGTTRAFRGFEEFLGEEGITIADDASSFRQAMQRILGEPPLVISEDSRERRKALHWPRVLEPFVTELKTLQSPTASVSCRASVELLGQ